MIKRILDMLERRALYKSTCKELNKLSDHELKDIGINRGMITQIAYCSAYGEDYV